MNDIQNLESSLVSYDDRIKYLMANKKLRQVDVSRAIGATRGTVSKWLSGENTPANDYLVRLARLLETTPAWILYGDDDRAIESTYDIDDAVDYIDSEREKSRSMYIRELELKPDLRYDIDYLEEMYLKKIFKESEKRKNDYVNLVELISGNKDNQLSNNAGYFEVPVYDNFTANDNSCMLNKTQRIAKFDREITIIASASHDHSICYYSKDMAMTPKIYNGAQCLIDTSKNQVHDGLIYLVKYGVLLMIRELYRRPDGGVIMKAVNPNYDDVIIKNNELENLTVLGWLYSHNNIDVWPDRKLNS